MKYYTGTIDITFEQLDAEDQESLYEKIEEYIPSWLSITKINTEYYETEEDIRNNYVDDGAIERRLYDENREVGREESRD